MSRRPPRSSRTYPLFPYTPLLRSGRLIEVLLVLHPLQLLHKVAQFLSDLLLVGFRKAGGFALPGRGTIVDDALFDDLLLNPNFDSQDFLENGPNVHVVGAIVAIEDFIVG